MVNLCRLAEQAGMLHDIGKICIRATGEKRNHSVLGAEFIHSFLNASEESRQMERCIRYHHGRALGEARLPKDDLAYIIYEADNIAAAADRREKEEDGSAGFDSHVCLENIFTIFGERGETSSFALRPLDAGHFDNYPRRQGQSAASAGMYARIMETLKANFAGKDPLSMEPNELLRILEDTMMYVPSSTNREEIPDISLYDHVKVTAAAAGAMVRYFQDRGISDFQSACFGAGQGSFRAAPVFLLVSADFSGIQNFIYHIPSKGAMRMLRGRSFYLDILLENLADDLLEALDLSRANLIYSGGGHFYLLTDNTEKTKKILQDGFQRINEKLVEYFSVSLYVAGAWEEVSPNDLMGKEKKENIFRRVSVKMGQSKQRRYTSQLLEQLFSEDSAYNRPAAGHRECALCRRSVDDLSSYEAWRTGEEGEAPQVCPVCNGLYHLGKDLIQENSLFAVLSGTEPGAVMLPAPFGDRSIRSVNPADIEKLKGEGTLLRLYEKNQSRTSEIMAARLWTADYAARDSRGRVLEFSELADNAGDGIDGKGIRRLGVLRGDVDGLGAAFMAGFRKKGESQPDRYATLSRYAALSRSLSVFFKRIITEVSEKDLPDGLTPFYLFQSKEGQSRKIHVVYSGGDDFFLVGAWDDLLEFAVDLYRTFRDYTDQKLSFSAGLGLFSASYPISRMAAETGELEEAAKNLDLQKNKIALFGCSGSDYGNLPESGSRGTGEQSVYTWAELTDEVAAGKLKFLLQYMALAGIDEDSPKSGQKIPVGKSLLYRLMNILIETRGKRFNLAHFAYAVARMETKDDSKKESSRKLRNQLYEWALTPKDRKQMITALQLLIYRMRDK